MINNKTTNLQGEAAIIGTLLREPDGYSYVRDLLEPKHFSEPVAASTYEVISRLSSRDKGHSLIDIKPYIDADAVIAQGQTVFQMLTNWTVHQSMPVFSLVDMAKSIIDLYKIRSLYSAAESLANQISNLTPDDDANALGEAAMAEIGSIISDGGEVYGAVSFGQAIKGALDATNEAHKGKLTNSVAFNFGPVDELISKLTAGQFMVVGGGTKQGKGQPLDADILTPFGYRKMGDLKIGSAVSAPDGSYSHVIGIYPLGERQIFEVKFHDGTVAEVTDDHIWQCWRSKKEINRAGVKLMGEGVYKNYTTNQIIRAMASNKKSSFHIPVTEPVQFTRAGSGKRLPIPPYVMGFLLGDGCFRKSTITLSCGDEVLIEKIEALIGTKLTSFGNYDYSMPGQPDYVAYLKRCGLSGKLSQEKFIPKQYLYAGIEDRFELARGLMDSDGWGGSGSKDAAAFFGTSSPKLADDVAWLMRSLGCVVNVHEKEKFYTYKGERKQGLNGITLRIKSRDASKLFSLDRKKKKCAAPRSMARTIISITPTRKAEAQCIRVSHPTSLYITNDFIVTHNTALAGQLLMGAARNGTPVWVYSGEMTAQELAMRESARESLVTVKRQKSGKVSESEYAKMMKFSEASQDLPVFIQQKRLNLDQIEERIKQFRHKKGFCLIVIDHLGLIERRKHEMRMEAWAFGEIVTGTLKRIAQEQEIAVIGCAQLKKNTFHDQREMISSKTFTQILSRRPKYSDLIGNIERDADHVILPFRPVVFLQEKEPVYGSDLHLEWEELVKQYDNKAQIVLALSRENKWPRSIDCGWQGNITSFIDLGGMKDKDQQSSNAYQGNPFALV